MKILVNKVVLDNFPEIANEKNSQNINDILKLNNLINNRNLRNCNSFSIFNIKNKSIKFHIPKIKLKGCSVEKPERSIKISDIISSKFKKENNNRYLNTDVKIYKTIQPQNRNIFYDSGLQIRNSLNEKDNNYRSYQTLSNIKRNLETFDDIHKIDLDKIITFTNNAFHSKSPKVKQNIKENQIRLEKERRKNRNTKFNSLKCFIDDYMPKENKEMKKYNINFRDYFGDSDYEKLIEKEKNYLTEVEKIRLIFKNTKLMKALCDYLNLSFVKIKNEKNLKIKEINKNNEEIRNQKKYKKFIENNLRLNLIPNKNIFCFNTKNNLKLIFKKRSPLIYKNGYLPNYKYK